MPQIELHKGFKVALRRFPIVSSNMGLIMTSVLFTFLLSAYLVRNNGLDIWSNWVYYSALLSLLSLVGQMGLKEDLLRKFSHQPKEMNAIWIENLFGRIPFLVVSCLISSFLLPQNFLFEGLIWMLFIWISKSFEVVYIFEKKFLKLLLAEILYWTIFGLLIYLNIQYLDLKLLIWFNLLATILKLSALIMQKKLTVLPKIDFLSALKITKTGFTFFILSLIGLLESKLDIFSIKFILGLDSIGKYSIIFSLLTFLKIIPNFLLDPFLKNFYRSNPLIHKKLNKQIQLFGIGISILGIVALQVGFEFMYHLYFSWIFYVGAAIFILPRYLYFMDLNHLLRVKKEHLIGIGITIGLITNTLLNFLFLKKYGLESAIWSAAAGQWVMFVFFKTTKEKGE